MNPVYIIDANVITALGTGLDSLFHGLVTGKQGLSTVSRFDTSAYISSHAGLIPDLVSQDTEKSSIITALAEILMKDTGRLAPESLLITASTKGPIDLIRNGTGQPVSGLPEQLSKKLELTRPGFNINAACASSTIALAKGADLIRRGREHTVVIVALDIITEFVFSGFSAIGAMSPLPAMPFDRDRQGLTLGEGAAILVLMGKKKLKDTNSQPLAQIKGWGIAGDAAHLTAPDKTGSGLKKAIIQACASADTSPDKLHTINAHGTGTVYNDAMEIEVFKNLFNPKTTMAHSIKGSIGHTLGAAGAIEAALCTALLEKKVLPGTLGLTHPAQGAKMMFSQENREFNEGPILTTNSGFGGINAALIIGAAR